VTFVVLFIIAAAWAIYAVFWWRGRSEHRSVNSISSFSKHLSILERTSPHRASATTRIAGPAPQSSVSRARPAFAPSPYRSAPVMSRRQARERRKNILLGLASASLVTMALAVLVGGSLWYLQVLCDLLLVAYVGLLVQSQRLALERQHKVHYLAPALDLGDRQASPLLLRQSAN
jgi:Flp pilus assembly protein TadB